MGCIHSQQEEEHVPTSLDVLKLRPHHSNPLVGRGRTPKGRGHDVARSCTERRSPRFGRETRTPSGRFETTSLVPLARSRSRDSQGLDNLVRRSTADGSVKETQHLVVDQVKDNVFVNQYMIIKDLGVGAHGSVKLVYNMEDDMLYAMKVVVKRKTRRGHTRRPPVASSSGDILNAGDRGQPNPLHRVSTSSPDPNSRPLVQYLAAMGTSMAPAPTPAGPLSTGTGRSRLGTFSEDIRRVGSPRSCSGSMQQAASGSLPTPNLGRLTANTVDTDLFSRISENSEIHFYPNAHESGNVLLRRPRSQRAPAPPPQPLAREPPSAPVSGGAQLQHPQPQRPAGLPPLLVPTLTGTSSFTISMGGGTPFTGSVPASAPGSPYPGNAPLARQSSSGVPVMSPSSRAASAETEIPVRNNPAELAVMKGLDHPNVVKLYEAIVEGPDRLMMIMEYVEGGCVMEGTLPTTKAAIEESVALQYFRDVLQGLEYLHFNSIVHGDIKPDNLLLTIGARVKITDFGSARLCEMDDTLTTPTGTPAFFAPEMCGGTPYNGFRGDMWAVGASLYMFVFGHPPFPGRTSYQVYEAIQRQPLTFPAERPISWELQHLLRALLTKDPAMRCTMEAACKHPWVTSNGRLPLRTSRDYALERACEVLHGARMGSSPSALSKPSAADLSMAALPSVGTLPSVALSGVLPPAASPPGNPASGSAPAQQHAPCSTLPGHVGADIMSALLGDANDALHSLMSSAVELSFSDGEVLVRQGAPVAGLYVILDGSCDVVRPRPERKLVPDTDFADALDGSEDDESSDDEAAGATAAARQTPTVVEGHHSGGRTDDDEVDLIGRHEHACEPLGKHISDFIRNGTISMPVEKLHVDDIADTSHALDVDTSGSSDHACDPEDVDVTGHTLSASLLLRIGSINDGDNSTFVHDGRVSSEPRISAHGTAGPPAQDRTRSSPEMPMHEALPEAQGHAHAGEPAHGAATPSALGAAPGAASTAVGTAPTSMPLPLGRPEAPADGRSLPRVSAATAMVGGVAERQPICQQASAPLRGLFSASAGRLQTQRTTTTIVAEPLSVLSQFLGQDEARQGGGANTAARLSNTRMLRAIERSASMQERMFALVAKAKMHAKQEKHRGGTKLLCHRGPGALIGSISGVRSNGDITVVARGRVRALLITRDIARQHRDNPLVRVALRRSADALLVQEALERFVECEKNIRMDAKIRNTAARLWLDSEPLQAWAPRATDAASSSTAQPQRSATCVT